MIKSFVSLTIAAFLLVGIGNAAPITHDMYFGCLMEGQGIVAMRVSPDKETVWLDGKASDSAIFEEDKVAFIFNIDAQTSMAFALVIQDNLSQPWPLIVAEFVDGEFTGRSGQSVCVPKR